MDVWEKWCNACEHEWFVVGSNVVMWWSHDGSFSVSSLLTSSLFTFYQLTFSATRLQFGMHAYDTYTSHGSITQSSLPTEVYIYILGRSLHSSIHYISCMPNTDTMYKQVIYRHLHACMHADWRCKKKLSGNHTQVMNLFKRSCLGYKHKQWY